MRQSNFSMLKKNNLFYLLLSTGIFAQTNPREHISGFNMASFTYKHNRNWSVYLETQARAVEDFSNIDYYELKGGVGYNISKDNQAFLGLGRYGNYKNSDFYQKEFRIWLQYVYSHSYSKLRLDHRVRFEKRFFEIIKTRQITEDIRARYRLTATLPLNGEKVKPGVFFVNAFEEIFFAPKEPNFKRNRLFGGFGYQFNENVGSNLGYLWQREFSASSNRNLHFLYFGLNFQFDRSKFNDNRHVPVAD